MNKLAVNQTPNRTSQKLSGIKVIAFDADDTLWVNETFFREAETRFCELVQQYAPSDEAYQRLFEIEMQNLALYGYGIKPFTLSLIEAAMKVSGGQVTTDVIEKIIELGKLMLEKPVELLPGIQQTLRALATKYRLVMATKGDLLDQQRKLTKSGLESYFHHIEIVADKTPRQYQKLVTHLDIQPAEFLMVGNSLKSDILPALEIGAYGFHVPFHTTWAHEQVEQEVQHPHFKSFTQVQEIVEFL